MNKPNPLEAERAAFEAFYLDSRQGRGRLARENLLNQRGDGTYASDSTQRHWWTWQNARAAIASREEAEKC